MKKIKLKAMHQRDDKLPSKPDAPAAGKRIRTAAAEATLPSYGGSRKTDKMPNARAQANGPTKASLKPGTVHQPSGPQEVARADQVVRATRKQPKAAAGTEQYVRIRIRVRDDRLSVIDSHLVDGPLAQARRFSGANAYEVTVGDKLLFAESLPDLGVQRSFVNPSGPPEQHGHHITERTVYEFMARVPANEVSPESIGKMAVRLLRVKDETRTDRLGSTPLTRQFERQIRQVAEIVGLPISVLPKAIEERGGRTPNA
jgi:hypothetical protein